MHNIATTSASSARTPGAGHEGLDFLTRTSVNADGNHKEDIP